MSHVQTTVVGSYPRVGETRQEQRLRRALEAVGRGEISSLELAEIQDDVTREILNEQIQAGVDIPTDGAVRWDDPISYLAGKISGFKIGGLLRYFDTNCYYRQPVAVEKLRSSGPLLTPEFRAASSFAARPIKVILTGPYTLARLCAFEAYSSFDAFLDDLAVILAQEVKALEQAGARYLQLDEPALLSWPEDHAKAKRALGKVLAGVRGLETTLLLNYGRLDGLAERLNEFPVDVLALDFTLEPSHLELAKTGKLAKKICAGVLNARNTRMEDPKQTHGNVRALRELLGERLVYISPNYSLEFLPRETARRKLELLREIRPH